MSKTSRIVGSSVPGGLLVHRQHIQGFERRGGLRFRSRHWLLVWLLSVLALACWSEPQQRPTGGETHFLTLCNTDGAACGGELSCLCGACSVPCEAQAACGGYASAECVAADDPGACGLHPPVSHCEVRCVVDEDCATLSAAHRCESGFCRAAPSPPTLREPLSPAPTSGTCVEGEVSADEVLIIGDSFFAAGHQVPNDLVELAAQVGALQAGQQYRDASRLTNNTLALMGSGIADQYAAAAVEAQPRVVIATGGGADALLGSCERVDADCPLLVAAANAAETLLMQMAEDGVAHVIYVFYPDPREAGTREKVDALRPLVQRACDESPVPCHWLDLRPSFAGRYDDYIQPDGMNPTPAGARVVAEQIWALMESECIAQ